MKSYLKIFMPAIIVLVISIVTLAVIVITSNNNFNNGICKECGGHYQLVDAGLYTKYYVCDTCGNQIQN